MTSLQQNCHGFYLIEVLVSLAIGAILYAIAVPSVREMLGGHELKQEVAVLSKYLADFSLKSQQHEKTVEVLVTRDNYSAWEIGKPRTEILTHVFSGKVKAQIPEKEQLIFHYYQTGTTSPNSVTLSDGVKKCKITLALRGRVASTC